MLKASGQIKGGGLFNTRHAYSKNINSSTISKLALKWQFNAGFDVFVTPAVSNDGIIYFQPSMATFMLLMQNLAMFCGQET
jgi:hypothetical protein